MNPNAAKKNDPEHHHIFHIPPGPESFPSPREKKTLSQRIHSASGWALLRKSIEELYDPNMKTVTFRASHLALKRLFSLCGFGWLEEVWGGWSDQFLEAAISDEGNEIRYIAIPIPKESRSQWMGIIYLPLPSFTWSFLWIHFDHFGRFSHFLKQKWFVIPTDVANPFEDSNGKWRIRLDHPGARGHATPGPYPRYTHGLWT